jgi:hypothetical protein
MSPVFANKVTRKDFELAPEGLVWATLKEVKDIGTVRNSFGNDRPKLLFTWETDLTDSEGNQIKVFERLTNTLHKKGWLAPRIKDLTGVLPDEEADCNLTALEGTRAQLMIKHNQASDGRTFANIAAVIRQPKNQVVEANKVAEADPTKRIIKAIKRRQEEERPQVDEEHGDAWEPDDNELSVPF